MLDVKVQVESAKWKKVKLAVNCNLGLKALPGLEFYAGQSIELEP